MSARLIDTIYVDKHGDDDHLPDTWTYYRITSVAGLGNSEGTEESTIQVFRVKWPTFDDIPPVNDSPGVVTLAPAYEIVNNVLK